MTDAPTDLSDEHLAQLIQQGDKEQFGVLMERYHKKLFRYGQKFLFDKDNIEDIVQEVFIKTYQNINSFDSTQRFSPWIYRIAHNTFINEIRRHSRNPLQFFDFDVLISHPADEDPAVKEREQNEMRTMLDSGLEKVKANYREILILYYLEELSYKEIAEILRIPVGTVGIRLKRAKDSLKKVYEKQNISYGE
jgi:RNA polymerase sigma-70 factor (ECF subfamily)